MKRKIKIIISLVMIITIISISVINSFAYYNFTTTPSDIGNKITSITINDTQQLKKYYLKITTKQNIGNYTFRINTKFNTRDVNVTYQLDGYQTGNEYFCRIQGNSYYGITGIVILPYSSIEKQQFTSGVYLPMYLYNSSMNEINDDYVIIEIYESTTIDIDTLRQEAYTLGFTNGYNDGYNAGYPEGFDTAQGLKQDLNIVEHIKQLIEQFTGSEVTKYITPIAIVITILLVYFLFIRFLLSLIKAKGILKVCDIIMVTACIAILMVMYIPMINFEITQHQIVETIYRVAQDTTITTLP